MSRILLVDDSPHAQRIGERILSEEGYEVVTVSNADSALIRLEDVDPDLVLADTVMPGRTGYELCQYLKMSPRHRRVRVILTAGVLEDFDAEQLKRAAADATLKKPFEATALLAAVKPLAEAAEKEREQGSGVRDQGAKAPPAVVAPFVAVVDSEQVKAAVTVALDAAMEAMVSEVTARVLAALQSIAPAAAVAAPRPSAPGAPASPAIGGSSLPPGWQAKAPAPQTGSASSERSAPKLGSDSAGPKAAPQPGAQGGPLPQPAAPGPAAPTPVLETLRRVHTVRVRPSSILGLDLEPDLPPSDSHSDPRSNSK